MIFRKDLIVAVLLTFCLAVLLFQILPISSQGPSDYDPWYDVNDDGKIDMRDIGGVARKFGASGTNITKTSLEYDSDWIDITDKAGQYFNVTHNLNSTDIIVDITGKKRSDSGPRQNFYGLTTHIVADPGWNYTYGRASGDRAFSMVQTSDGGYAMVGDTRPFPADGDWGVWLVKTDAKCNHLWNQTYGGLEMFSDDRGRSVVQTTDGGYAITGAHTGFVDIGDFSHDVWLIKTDATGNHLWNKTYGDLYCDDWGVSVVQTTDGGYAIAGYTSSFGIGVYNCYLVKTDADGVMQWNKTYGGTIDFEFAFSMVQTADGGYALAGQTYSFDAGGGDFYLVKTDADGVMQWNKTYGGTGYDTAEALVQTADGGYALAGWTDSFGAGAYDFWLVKTDAAGNHLWNKTYGGTGIDTAYSMMQTLDGGYVIAGETTSFGAGSSDFWLAKTFGPGEAPMIEVWLAWTASTSNTINLYRGEDDPYWNYIRVRIWKIKENP